jgi:Protein of unknown function (DUF2917)
MNHTDLNRSAINLHRGEVHRIRRGRGQRIEALSGTLWVTIDNDLRDIFVAAGQGFSLDSESPTLISAVDDSRFLVLGAQ